MLSAQLPKARTFVITCFICTTVLIGRAHAEPPKAVLRGTVLDPARTPIPGAHIEVSSGLPPRTTTVQSGADGNFAVALDPGHYKVAVSAGGFESATRETDLATGAPTTLEILLNLPAQREVVTVSETANYQTVISSSTRTPTLMIDTPQSISVITNSLIKDQSMQNMADVVRYVPGITMAQGEGHRDAPVIRGNATTSDFYVNGIRDDVQYYRDLYNVERVEAVKGANALTFGRGGGGGVINRVTKQPDFSPVREISLQGGSFNNRRFTTDLGQNWGERLAFRLNGVFENSHSFRHDVGIERFGAAPSLTWRLTGNTAVRFAYEYFEDDRTVDRGFPSYQGLPVNANRSTFFGDPDSSYAGAAVHLGSVSVEHQAGRWNLRNATLFGDYNKFYQNVFSGSVNANESLVALNGYNNRTLRKNVFNQTDATAIVFTGSIRHTILTGTEVGRQESDNFRNTAYFNGDSTSLNVPFLYPNVRSGAVFRQSATDADNRAVNHLAGVFLQDQMELTRHIQLVAGVRYDHFAIDFRNRRTSEQLGRSDNMLSPRLGLIVKPMAQLSLYGSYSVTYLPSSGDQFSSLNATTQTLRPEKFENFEAGAKWDVNRRLNFTTAVYRLDRNNSTARDPNDPARIVQTGSQRTNGVEIGVNGNLTSRWMVVGGYAAQDAFVSSPTTAALLDAKVALVPRHTFSLWNNYRLLSRWSAGLGIIHQSDMFAGIDNTVRLPGFTRADVATFYSLTEKVRLQANLENLFNTNYFPTAHSNNNILPGSPLAVRVGLSARF